MSVQDITCPGCGQKHIQQNLQAPPGYDASGECYQEYTELSYYTLNKQDIHFIHQHAIDTYSAQHAGKNMKNITVAFSLIGLYFAVEQGFTGKQVQRVHMLLSKQKYPWPGLDLPTKPYSITVHNVLKQEPGENRDAMLRKWMENVWECWEHQHNWVREISKKLLY